MAFQNSKAVKTVTERNPASCMLERAIKTMQIHALTDNPEFISSLSSELQRDFQKAVTIVLFV